MPKSENMRQASQERILAAAMQLFVTKGYHATSTRDITEAAGISKGLIYNYYRSKEDILEAILEARTQNLGAVIAQCKVLGDVGASIGRIIMAYCAMLRRDRDYLRFRTALVLQPGIPKVVLDMIQDRVQQLFSAIESLLSELGHPTPKRQVYQLMAQLEGMGLHYLGVLEDYPLTEMEQLLIEQYGQRYPPL